MLVLVAVALVVAAVATRPSVRLWLLHGKCIRRANRGVQRLDVWLVLCRDVDRARAELDPKRGARAAFLRACLELEAGDLGAARLAARELPSTEAVRTVLENLIATRSTDNGPWLPAFEAAWKASGRPDLRGCPFLSDDAEASADVPRRPDELSATDRILWRFITWRPTYMRRAMPAAVVEWAKAAGAATDDPGELMLAATIPPGDRISAAVLEKLVAAHPDDFWVRLTAFFAPTGRGALEERDLAALENVLEAERCDAFLGGLGHARLVRAATRAGSRTPVLLAARSSLGSPLCGAVPPLLQRFRSTDGPLKLRAAEVYARLGRRMMQDRYGITFALGYRMLHEAEDAGAAGLAEELATAGFERQRLVSISERALAIPANWPIPSMIEEAVAASFTDERALYAAYWAPPPV